MVNVRYVSAADEARWKELFRSFARPSTGTVGLWLDDLFTDASGRNAGVGRALIAKVAEIGRAEGCSMIRGITAADNHTAQALYDKVATRAGWVTYEYVL